jgi:CubicO group peptidase (beta-lactamase class C family)
MGALMMHQATIDAGLQQGCESGAIAGAVAMATTGAATIYQGAFGRRDVTRAAPMTADSVFWIASMTKAITTAAALQLVEQGKLSLDGPLDRLVPELAHPQVLEGFAADGAPLLRPAKSAPTLRRLLTHTSGYSYDMWNGAMLRYLQATGTPKTSTCRNAALRVPLMFDPGARWEYGIGIDFVGKVVEAASGQRLGAYMHDHLFAPLGMRDTAFRIGEAQRARLVAMHARAADGGLAPIAFEIEQAPEFEMGGGGRYGTAADYLAFVRMILNRGAANGHQVLRPETVAMMGESQIGGRAVGRMVSAVPAASNDVELCPGAAKTWGFGFLINTEATAEGRSPGSLAWAGLGNTYYWIDPRRDVAGVILMQVLPFADAGCLDAFARFERAIYAGLRPAA